MKQGAQELTIMTLVFPDSLSNIYPRTVPLAHHLFPSGNQSIQSIPSTGNTLAPLSQDTTLAFALPDDEASAFLTKVQEIPNSRPFATEEEGRENVHQKPKGWVMKAASSGGDSRSSFGKSARNGWTAFVDLLKVRIIILPVRMRECYLLRAY